MQLLDNGVQILYNRYIQYLNEVRQTGNGERDKMEKYYDLLYCLNREPAKSQRALAAALHISVGQVNYMLRFLEEQGYLEKSSQEYRLTGLGQEVLEEMAQENRKQKLALPTGIRSEVKTAVILAAGENKAFEKPVGLLEIEGKALLELLIEDLKNLGIENFWVVAGHGREQIQEYFRRTQIRLLFNEHYKWTGTMASLACIQGSVREDFLLVEGNQILESRGFEALLKGGERNGVLLSTPSGSKDEAYVELDDQGCIFRISKDIRQMNRVDAELLGVSRISLELFQKMMEYYSQNENPYLNYEYVIENIGRIYQIPGIMADDLVWTVIENPHLYQYAGQRIYPRIRKKVRQQKENRARQVLQECLGIPGEQITEVETGGGMTNQNFLVTVRGERYILRLPGACTETMIDREREYYNTMYAAKEGLNPAIAYFDKTTGIKLTAWIPGAQTLNGKSARLESNMKRTSQLLRRLHQSGMPMKGEFDVWKEYQIYKKLAEENQGVWYPGFQEMEHFFLKLQGDLQFLGKEDLPCHNDLVAENFVKDSKGRMYLIDWEYAGRNDPMWDVAAHLLECGFEEAEEELFLKIYFENREVQPVQKQKIALYKICQDVLWSAWTIAKEAVGEEFGTYGQERFARAQKNRKEYEYIYGA